MGIVFQNYALFENMAVLGNVEYALKRNRETRGEARQIALRLIEQVGLTEHRISVPHKLSGGQRRRVASPAPWRSIRTSSSSTGHGALDVDTRLSLRQELKAIQKQFGSTWCISPTIRRRPSPCPTGSW